ncbi:MAG TPA: hypothetical protein VG245_08300 [Candidatus Dormibacteraeota bacterium]|nr:hypothetical protein [Candidatus Dormibacteraeota bacterium]
MAAAAAGRAGAAGAAGASLGFQTRLEPSQASRKPTPRISEAEIQKTQGKSSWVWATIAPLSGVGGSTATSPPAEEAARAGLAAVTGEAPAAGLAPVSAAAAEAAAGGAAAVSPLLPSSPLW